MLTPRGILGVNLIAVVCWVVPHVILVPPFYKFTRKVMTQDWRDVIRENLQAVTKKGVVE
eukprot:COSAG01_NODE_1729_length_9372_cov_17.444948_7_plen_60_part_00